MATRDEQDIRYWITPAGCAVVDDHRADLDQHHCRVCGVRLDEVIR
jgi:ribosomal protein L34E